MRLRRDIRYSSELVEQDKIVRFKDLQGDERSCQVRDFSRTGLSFHLEDGSLIFHIGDIISDMRFFSFDTEVHSCAATIVHVQDEYQDGKVISRIGCHFEKVMDVSSVIQIDRVTKLRNDYLDFIQSLAVEDNLDEEFVHLTSHLHYLLNNFRKKLKEEEEKVLLEEEPLRGSLLDTLRTMSFTVMNDLILRCWDSFNKITCSFADSKQSFIHRTYFQKMANEFLLSSRLFNRAYTKPLGYAGDYEMMNIIYRNDFEGDDVFSQVMNKIDCEGSAAKAVRNRRGYLCKSILSVCNGLPEGETCKIVSIACGPCVEMADFFHELKECKLPINIRVVAMDQDQYALDNARKRLLPLQEELPEVDVRFIRDNIKHLILGRDKEKDSYSQANIIYSAGLCDYLSPNAVSRLIQELYKFLKPGGCLIIGNFGPFNPQRFEMEYGGEWFLIHRSEEELKSLARSLPEDVTLRVDKEPEGVNLFLNVIKPA